MERPKIITSSSNQIIKEALNIKKNPKDFKDLFLVEGPHLIKMAIKSPYSSIVTLFMREDYFLKKDCKNLLHQTQNSYIVTNKIFSQLADTETPQGIIGIVHYKLAKLSDVYNINNSLFVVCDSIQDPGNLGTIIRSADAFGANAVVILPASCNPFNSKVLRATAGSIFNIPIIKNNTEEALDFFLRNHIEIFATSSKAKKTIFEVKFNKSIALIFGNESSGVSLNLLKNAHEVFRIPIIGKAESLNVAMATTVCLYEVMRQRVKKKRII
ncbi:MAG: RNA methyltransferase [Thermodesulfovibrionales bacterium]|nr:RNA methyltransferase [Thermodesulfovibrionales bacterium]